MDQAYRDRVEALRQEWELETGEPMDFRTAEVLLDRQDDAEYERREGGAYGPVEVEDHPTEEQWQAEAEAKVFDPDVAYERYLESQDVEGYWLTEF